MSDIHIAAWEKGLKSLYYCRSKAATKANVGTGRDKPLNAVPVKTVIEYDANECLSCHG
jgi:ribonucleoside-diphosphate reductase alpha chain